jgi:hypothetical protein
MVLNPFDRRSQQSLCAALDFLRFHCVVVIIVRDPGCGTTISCLSSVTCLFHLHIAVNFLRLVAVSCSIAERHRYGIRLVVSGCIVGFRATQQNRSLSNIAHPYSDRTTQEHHLKIEDDGDFHCRLQTRFFQPTSIVPENILRDPIASKFILNHTNRSGRRILRPSHICSNRNLLSKDRHGSCSHNSRLYTSQQHSSFVRRLSSSPVQP